jgi:hypothetical protein
MGFTDLFSQITREWLVSCTECDSVMSYEQYAYGHDCEV